MGRLGFPSDVEGEDGSQVRGLAMDLTRSSGEAADLRDNRVGELGLGTRGLPLLFG